MWNPLWKCSGRQQCSGHVSCVFLQGKGKMNTYWLVGHKNFSVQNDSLVCHWNPSMARKKKTPVGSNVSMANVSTRAMATSRVFSLPFEDRHFSFVLDPSVLGDVGCYSVIQLSI